MSTHRPRISLVLSAAGVAGVLMSGVAAQGPGGPHPRDRVNGHDAAPNEVIVKYKAPKSAGERAAVNATVDAEQDDDLGAGDGRTRHVKSRRFDAATLVAYFRGAPDVEYAEPNYLLYAIHTPTDPNFGQLWGLLNTGQVVGSAGTSGADIDATLAWNITTGSAATVVGVVDTGVDYTHPDLAANIWSAPTSFTVNIGGNSYTCPAGSHGFNAFANSCDPKDDNNHGTHVSGTIGARANNGVGVAGVNWTASIMGLKFLGANGSGSTVDAVEAIEFAIQAKQKFGAAANVRVLSNSWGGGGFSQTLFDEIKKAKDANMLFVAAAGNSNSNNDSGAFYPSNYALDNVVAVAATDNNDGKASFSSYGATTVDLGAPGVYVLSTIANNQYAYYSGTSMATPHVAGAAALVLSVCSLDTLGLKNAILNNVDLIASMSGITVTGGRLNVYKALTSCGGGQPSAPPAPTGLTATPGSAKVTLQWNASAGATSYNVKRSTTSGGETLLNTTSSTSFVDGTAVNGTQYYYVVTAVKSGLESGNSNEATAKPTAPPVAPLAPTNLDATRGPGKKSISLKWTASAGATSYAVKRALKTGGPYTAVGTVTGTSFKDAGLADKTTYFYVVTASNSGGVSGPSNEASEKTQ